jgi:hypothetical protein
LHFSQKYKQNAGRGKKEKEKIKELGTCLSDMTAAASETPATELKLGS